MNTLTRRNFIRFLITAGISISNASKATDKTIYIGITPVFLIELTSVLRDWQNYLEQKLDRPVIFVQRDSYREIIIELLSRRLDFAWICGYPFIVNHRQLRLVSIPVYQGKPLYQSYFIVPVRDTSTQSIIDLKGRLFAYTDPDSNSGFLIPRFHLKKAGYDPDTFFKKTFFSSGHRNAIEAVSSGLANGAYVDGYVWDSLTRFKPEFNKQTRLVSKSSTYGFPPIVAGPSVTPNMLLDFQKVLISMQNEPDAISILKRLNIDGFSLGKTTDFDAIKKMAIELGEFRNAQ